MFRVLPLILVSAVLAFPALADQASAVAQVKSLPKVVDAKVDGGGNMYVLVKPENAAWPQFAGYVCKVVKPHQARIFKVRVIDLTKAPMTQPPGNWGRLGEANCG